MSELPGHHVTVRTRYHFFFKKWYHVKHYPPGVPFSDVVGEVFRLIDVWGQRNVMVYYIPLESTYEQDRLRGPVHPPGGDVRVR